MQNEITKEWLHHFTNFTIYLSFRIKMNMKFLIMMRDISCNILYASLYFVKVIKQDQFEYNIINIPVICLISVDVYFFVYGMIVLHQFFILVWHGFDHLLSGIYEDLILPVIMMCSFMWICFHNDFLSRIPKRTIDFSLQ